jgi:fumarylpyruvate hydrolase
MGRDPDREPPFFFTKWAETVVPDGSTIAYPPETKNYQYEAELVVAINKGGSKISNAEALNHVYGYATGLDMTRRDVQFAARDLGRPWDAGKNFEQSAPLGLIHPASVTGHFDKGNIKLTVNGEVKQNADLTELIWPVPDVIAFLSKYYTLQPGDLIYTGTPAGVGAVVSGDSLEVSIDGLAPLHIKIGPATS